MNRRPEDAWSIDELLACEGDFVLCNAVFGRFARVDNVIDVSAYGEEERVVTLVWHSLGVIENGGFEYLLGADYPGDPGFVLTAASYRTIGALTAHRAFQDALACFPSSSPPAELEARRRCFAAAPRAERDRLDRQFWAAVPETRARLAAFIRSRRDAVRALLAG